MSKKKVGRPKKKVGKSVKKFRLHGIYYKKTSVPSIKKDLKSKGYYVRTSVNQQGYTIIKKKKK